MSAILSPCGHYRYWLMRVTGAGKRRCLFVMLNPSTADAEQDDPTIRRCIRFAARAEFGVLTVVNLYALRATNPTALEAAVDPVGPDNDTHVAGAAMMADLTVVAWGAHPLATKRAGAVLALLRHPHCPPLKCLGLTKSGAPRHPLYVRADAPLIDYPAPQEPQP